MPTPTVYVICDSNCKFESMTKEQIIAAILEAVNEGTISDIDAGFVTKLKEQNAGGTFTIWTGSQAQYNAIPEGERVKGCLYIITDDDTIERLYSAFDEYKEEVDSAIKQIDRDKADALVAPTLVKSYDTKQIAEAGYYYISVFLGDDGTPVSDVIGLVYWDGKTKTVASNGAGTIDITIDENGKLVCSHTMRDIQIAKIG